MKSSLRIVLCSLFSLSAAHAAVQLTFDTDAQGVTGVGWNSGSGGTAWSPNFGGSLAVTATVGGWSNPLLQLDLLSPTFQPELMAALANGGTLSFDFTVQQSDFAGYDPGSPPGWFELVAVGNSDGAAGGGWDQNVIGGANGFYGGIPVGPTTRTVTMNVVAGGPADDLNLSFGAASTWKELLIGFNSESGKYTGAIVYIDNIRLAANPIPEPSVWLLGALSLGGLFVRRCR
jgi:hypothetical protein